MRWRMLPCVLPRSLAVPVGGGARRDFRQLALGEFRGKGPEACVGGRESSAAEELRDWWCAPNE